MLEFVLKKFFDMLDYFLAHQVPSKLGYGHQINGIQGLDANSRFIIKTISNLNKPVKVIELAAGRGILAQEILTLPDIDYYLACDIDPSGLEVFTKRIQNQFLCISRYTGQEPVKIYPDEYGKEPVHTETHTTAEELEILVESTAYHTRYTEEQNLTPACDCDTGVPAKVESKVKTHVMNILQPDITENETFDIVIADKFIHLLAPDEVEKVFQYSHSLLKDGGLFIVSSVSITNMVYTRTDEGPDHPLYRKLKNDLVTRLWYNIKKPYVFFLTEEFVQQLADNTGFEVKPELICPEKENYLTLALCKKTH